MLSYISVVRYKHISFEFYHCNPGFGKKISFAIAICVCAAISAMTPSKSRMAILAITASSLRVLATSLLYLNAYPLKEASAEFSTIFDR